MVDNSFADDGPTYPPPRGYPEWVKRCEPNQKSSTLAVGALVRPNFRNRDEFRAHPIGRIEGIVVVSGTWRAYVAWDAGEIRQETAPRWALTDQLGED